MASKKEIVDEVVTAVEEAGEEVKKAAKKAAPKAKAAVEDVEKKAEKAAKDVEKKAEKAAKDVEKKAEKAVKDVEKKAEKAAKDVEKKVEKAAKDVEKKAEKAAKEVEEKAVKATKKVAKRDEADEPRLKVLYMKETAPAMKEKFNYENSMMIPRLEKVIINMGLGSDKDNPKAIEQAVKELTTIAGQKAVICKAKKSVANFKVREGMNIGAKVTLRNDRMYYFVDKFINIVLPRVRDFRGVSDKSFDGRGNYALGVKEQLIFPEINYDDVDKVRGMNIVFVTSAKTDEEAKALLALLGMPFVQD